MPRYRISVNINNLLRNPVTVFAQTAKSLTHYNITEPFINETTTQLVNKMAEKVVNEVWLSIGAPSISSFVVVIRATKAIIMYGRGNKVIFIFYTARLKVGDAFSRYPFQT